MLSAELSNEDYQSLEMAAKELDRRLSRVPSGRGFGPPAWIRMVQTQQAVDNIKTDMSKSKTQWPSTEEVFFVRRHGSHRHLACFSVLEFSFSWCLGQLGFLNRQTWQDVAQ